jgi:hypothetical protein
MINSKNIALIPICLLATMCSISCSSQPIRILSERILSPPVFWWFSSPTNYDEYYGVKEEDIRKIWEGIKILRTTLMEKGEDYIFEIQCAGDIEFARKKYGNRVLFQITGIPDYNIFTTGFMNEAVLVERECINVLVTTNEKDEMISAKMISPSKEVARLNLEIDRDKMRIYLPRKYLPEKEKRERSGRWLENKPESFGWTVKLRLAIEPGKPIPSNIRDVFYAPTVYMIHYPPGVA